ncbi:type II toxin-antitoxin system PemK/MazF family toxin [Paraclostridium bifermentans]
MKQERIMHRGDIFTANLGKGCGCEQGGFRPVLIVQNEEGIEHGSTVAVLSITASDKRYMPTHLELDAGNFGLVEKSIVLAETVRAIDKRRLCKYVGTLDEQTLGKVDKILKLNLGL